MSGSPIPAANAPSPKSRRRRTLWAGGGLLLMAVGALGLYFAEVYWPYRYRNVEPLLEQVLASKVKIDHYHRTYFPHPGFVATGLTLRRNNASDLPPVGTAEELHVEGEWNDLLMLHRSIPMVYIRGLHIVIPPVGSRANHEDFPPGSSVDFAGPATPVERLHLHDAELDIQRTHGGEYKFPIRDLIIENLHRGDTIIYELDMVNAMPQGHILSHGSFGPLQPQALGATRLSGEFTFSEVKLKDFGAIGGVLSSYGSFQGTIASIAAGVTATVPDFSVGHGRPAALAGSVRGTINGLNADVVLEDIQAKTGTTIVKAQGRVVALKKDAPKTTDLDVVVQHGRVEDLLGPFLHDRVPVIGAVSLQSHVHLAPSGRVAQFLHRLTLDGVFDVPAERLRDRAMEKSLSGFSERAQGSKGDVKGDAEPDVFSSVQGPVTIRDGVASSRRLTLTVPGARADLNGTFAFESGAVHLVGNLRMQSNVSHVTTGWKSFLLKPLIPFFKGRHAGAVIPIAITGTPGQYKVGQDLLHNK